VWIRRYDRCAAESVVLDAFHYDDSPRLLRASLTHITDSASTAQSTPTKNPLGSSAAGFALTPFQPRLNA
jgi:hypothetical protein